MLKHSHPDFVSDIYTLLETVSTTLLIGEQARLLFEDIYRVKGERNVTLHIDILYIHNMGKTFTRISFIVPMPLLKLYCFGED